MFQLSAPLRAFVQFIERYDLNQILAKFAKAHRYANSKTIIPGEYEIPSLIWPPPLGKVKSCAVLLSEQIYTGGHHDV